jgi:hypothetical protein
MDDEAVEVAPASLGSVTGRLPEADLPSAGLGDLMQVPMDLLPAETQAHLRAAGREAVLFASSLSGNLLKGLAVTLNTVAEVLNTYTERHSNPTARSAEPRRRVDIEIE